MVISSRPIWGGFVSRVWRRLETAFDHSYERGVVYGDADETEVLYDGPLRLLANGWLEVGDGRLLSPDAVHHVDVTRRE